MWHLGVESVQLDHPSAGAEILTRTGLAELGHSQRQNAFTQSVVTPGSTGEIT
jgi:hypothetical protein